jgi:DNA polymerase-3 subunit alpha
MNYVSLHIHTEYSYLDGLIRIPALMERVKNLGQSAVAITEHNHLASTYEAFKEAKKQNIKYIPGVEAYFAEDRRVKSRDIKDHHLILLCKNERGYKNLLQMNFEAFQTGLYRGHARVDWDLLSKYHEGLICTSACLAGPIDQAFMNNDEKAADKLTEKFLAIFKEDFYYELQSNKMADQKKVNKCLLNKSKKNSIPIYITTDAHYLNKEDFKVHDMLLAIQVKKPLNDPDRFRFDDDEFYIKSGEEITQLSGPEGLPDSVITDTVEVAEKCEWPYYLESKGYHLPEYPVEEAEDYQDFLEWRKKKNAKTSVA